MATNPNRLSRFWQELNRRRVTRTVTVYAAAAFVILELVSIIVEPLKLPEWTLPFIIVLLCVGFIIAVILSWIYDIHPDGGFVKTEPVHKFKSKDIPKSSNSWKIASYISFMVIVGLIVLNVLPRIRISGEFDDLETSIAVLPFENMSDDVAYSYIGGAFTDEIIMELQKIKAFDRVLSRTSTMQYEENRPTIPEIAEKLNVNYIIEGSIQRLEGRVRIRVQVIRTSNEDHIWGESYDEVFIEPSDILDIQSRIAQSVADELEVRITPEELEMIKNVPTTSLTALDFFQRGRDEHQKYYNSGDIESLKRAKDLYHEAIEYDLTFARAYTGLAWVVLDEQYWETYSSDTFLDSVMILADIALNHDHQLSEAYTIRGIYFRHTGKPEQALKEFKKAKDYNPNDWIAYYYEGLIYWRVFGDNIKRIDNFKKAISLHRGEELPDLLYYLGRSYLDLGFADIAENYYQEAYTLDGDDELLFGRLSWVEFILGNFEKAAEWLTKADRIDSINHFQLGSPYGDQKLGRPYGDPIYTLAGLDQKEYLNYMRLFEREKATGEIFVSLNLLGRVGYTFWKLGKYDEAEYYFNELIKFAKESINLGRDYASAKWAHYDLAGVYTFLGDKEQAYKYLDEFNTKNFYPLGLITLAKYDPLFENIRSEERFQNIIQSMEAKYQAEYERVKQWLEENGML